jgi:transposase InsO family protein
MPAQALQTIPIT